jgi:transcriptional regulator with XRE-family HTH domain
MTTIRYVRAAVLLADQDIRMIAAILATFRRVTCTENVNKGVRSVEYSAFDASSLPRAQLAAASKVAKATIANFELGKRSPYDRTLDDLGAALEDAGVEFILENGGGAGVRLRRWRGS